MDEIQTVRLEVMSDPEIGVVALSRLNRSCARLVRERAALVRAHSERLRGRCESTRRQVPPRWFRNAFQD